MAEAVFENGKKRRVQLRNTLAALRAISSERGLDLAWRTEVLKTSAWALLSVAVTGRKGFNGNRNQPNSLSAMERGKGEIGAEILVRISREFGKSIEWPPTGSG
jgi:hypothetical protein